VKLLDANAVCENIRARLNHVIKVTGCPVVTSHPVTCSITEDEANTLFYAVGEVARLRHELDMEQLGCSICHYHHEKMTRSVRSNIELCPLCLELVREL
jgi:hypothetical protein